MERFGWFWVYRFVNAFQFWRRLIKPKKNGILDS